MNMTMTYDGTMVMPKNFAVVTEDEMTYVDGGGWGTYKGWEGLAQITAIAGYGFGAAVLAGGCAELAGGTALTGVGIIAAIGLAFGCSLLIGLSGIQAAFTLAAANFFADSWAKSGRFSSAGFNCYTVSVWTFGACLNVTPL